MARACGLNFLAHPVDIESAVHTVEGMIHPQMFFCFQERPQQSTCHMVFFWLIPSAVRQHILQEAQLSPSDRAMRLVSSNLASCHAIVHKLLIRRVPCPNQTDGMKLEV